MSVFPERIVLKNTTDSLAAVVSELTPVGLSGAFNGSTSYLQLPASSVLAFGSGDFTVETWIYITSYAEYFIFDTIPVGGAGFRSNAMLWGINNAGQMRLYTVGAYRGATASALTLNQWNHIALTRTGTIWRFFINGIKDSTEIDFNVNLSLATGGLIGRAGDGSSSFLNGYLDDFRVTKGVARYSANFSTPTGPFPEGANDSNWANVSILLRMDGFNNSTIFTDSSSNALTVTAVGTARITNIYGRNAPTDPLAGGEVVVHRASGETRLLGNTSLKTISQLNAAIKNEDKGSLTVTNDGYGPASFVLNDGSVTNSKIADSSITEAKIFGTVEIADGGTGGFSRDTGLSGLLPSQTSNTGKVIATDGTNASWQTYETSPGTNDLANSDFLVGTVSINSLNDVNTVVTVNRTAGAFNGTTSYLTLPANAGLAFDIGDFTVETWVYLTSYANYCLFDTIPIGGAAARANAMVWYVTSAGKLQVYSNSTDRGASSSILPLNQWNHVALVRSGSTLQYYVNGVKDVIEYGYSVALTLATGCVIGRLGDSASYLLNGYLDDFRITKGLARYSSNFIPSPSPFPEGANDQYFSKVSLLLRMDGANGSTLFTDSSTNALTVTSVGGAQIASTNTTSTLPPNNQCLRWNSATSNWIPTEDITSSPPLSTISPGKPGQISKDLEYLYICTALNTWRRIPYSLWNYTLPRVPNLLSAGLAFAPVPGVADPERLNVSLLLHFDGANNSNVYADSSINAFTGSPQNGAIISTAQSKFGGSSGFFNGSNQYITFANNSVFHFEDKNFTIEAWVRLTSFSGEHCICSHSFGGFNGHSFTFSVLGSTAMKFRLMSVTGNSVVADYQPAFALVANTWYHVAAVRNGNSLRIFVNGSLPPLDLSITTTLHSPSAGSSTFKVGGSTPVNNGVVSNFFPGYIDDLRITKGVARYWTAFTPPAFPFPDR